MLNDFQQRAMQLITGQMPLPQQTFRQFLDEYLQATESDKTSDTLDVLDDRLEQLGIRVSDTESGVSDNRSTIEKLVDIISGLTTSLQTLDKRLFVKDDKLYVRYDDKLYECAVQESAPEEVEYIKIRRFNNPPIGLSVSRLKCYRNPTKDVEYDGVSYKAWTSKDLVAQGNDSEYTYYTDQEMEDGKYVGFDAYSGSVGSFNQWTVNYIMDYGKELVKNE